MLDNLRQAGCLKARFPRGDDDGRLDVAVTNGFMKTSMHPNRVLRNISTEGKPRLHDVTPEAGPLVFDLLPERWRRRGG